MIQLIFDVILWPSRLFGLPDWLAIVSMVLIPLYIFGTSTFDFFEKKGLKNNYPLPLIGNVHELFKYGTTDLDMNAMKKFGQIWGLFMGRTPVYVIADPNMAKQICVKDFSNFVNHNTLNFPIAELFKHFLTILKDDEWRGIRNVVTPTFSGAKMKALVPVIEECAHNLVAAIDKEVVNKNDFEVKDKIGHYTMNAVGATLFGIQIDKDGRGNDEFYGHAKAVFRENNDFKTILLLVISTSLPPIRWLLHLLNINLLGESEHWRYFVDLVEHVIKSRDGETKKRVDFLALLLDAHKQEMDLSHEKSTSIMDTTNETAEQLKTEKWNTIGKRALSKNEILANSLLFFLAGYETTASATSFALYLLALNEDKQQLLREEVDEAWNNNKGQLNYDMVTSMPYLDAVINESLRLYPPASRTDRSCNADCNIDGIEFKKGDWVQFAVWGIHHSDKYWPEPDRFQPERFLPENKDSIVPYSFLPFGLGPRNCVGQRLAYLEAKIALCCVLRHYTLHRNAKTEVPLQMTKGSGLTSAQNGIYIDFKKRNLE